MLAAGGIGARSQIQAEDEDPSVGGWIGCPLWELSLLARHFNPEVRMTSFRPCQALLPLAIARNAPQVLNVAAG